MTLPGDEVDRPAVEGRGALVGAEPVGVEHLRVAHDVDDDPVAVVVGVERVEDVAGLDVEPADVGGGAAVAGHDPHPGRDSSGPSGRGRPGWSRPSSRPIIDLGHRLRASGACRRTGRRLWPPGARCGPGRTRAGDRVEVEHAGQVEEDDVALGEGEVVHHRAAGHLDVDDAADPGVGADHRVLHLVAPAPVVGHGVELAGLAGPASGGRCSRRAACRRSRRRRSSRVRRSARRAGRRPRRWRRCGPACTMTLVLAGKSQPAWTGAPGRGCLAERLGHVGGADEPVAVPLGLAVAQPDAVDHARCRGTSGGGPGRPGPPGWARCAGSGRRGGRAACP